MILKIYIISKQNTFYRNTICMNIKSPAFTKHIQIAYDKLHY